ncbi:MAG: mechanosensitive ion channel family protein [Erysipelotrichaceae bacterium]|jgi:small conductance mechanosensitive channel|nr:mechanosensitive ion channel family protein [Erysipelotrichaceae bacterium]
MITLVMSQPLAIAIDVIILLLLVSIIIFQIIFTKKSAATSKKHFTILVNVGCIILFLGLLVLGVVLTAEPLGFEVTLEGILQTIGTWIVNHVMSFINSLIIIAVSVLIINIARIVSILIPKRFTIDKNIKRKQTVAHVFFSLIKYLISIVALILVLVAWGINIIPALAGVGILGIVIGLGAQRFINDFICGLAIVFEHHFDVGDVIEIDGFKGTVTDIGLKSTIVKNWKNNIKIFANGDITKVINYSKFDTFASVAFKTSNKVSIKEIKEAFDHSFTDLKEKYPQVLGNPSLRTIIGYDSNATTFQIDVPVKSETQVDVERYITAVMYEVLKSKGLLPNDTLIIEHDAPGQEIILKKTKKS